MKSYGMTRKDLFNANNGSIAFKEAVGMELVVTGCATGTTVDAESGEEKTVSYIATKDAVYGGDSTVIAKAIDQLVDYMEDVPEGEEVVIKIVSFESKAGRTCFSINIL